MGSSVGPGPEAVRKIFAENPGTIAGMGLHSFTFSSTLSLCPTYSNFTHGCVPNVLMLSSNVNACRPLIAGVILEPVVGNSGFIVPDKAFLEAGRCRFTLSNPR
jgi:hypothetical protein